MSNILKGIGRAQLEDLDERVKARRDLVDRYVLDNGTDMDSNKVRITPYALMEVLEAENIEARPVWKPLHLQPLFEECKFYPHVEDDVVSERLFAEGLCLSWGSNMTVGEQERVIETLQKHLS